MDTKSRPQKSSNFSTRSKPINQSPKLKQDWEAPLSAPKEEELVISQELSVSDILKAKQYDLQRPQLKTADQCKRQRRKVAGSLDTEVALNKRTSQQSPLEPAPATNVQSQVSTVLQQKAADFTGSYQSDHQLGARQSFDVYNVRLAKKQRRTPDPCNLHIKRKPLYRF